MRLTSCSDSWTCRLEAAELRRRELGRDRHIRPPAGLDFSGNDYLGLRRDPRLAEAAARAARDHGTGAGASRLLGGTCPLHEALEEALADWKGTEGALLLGSGYQLNATLLPALLEPGDALFSDALNHASLVDGCRAAKARGVHVEVLPHGRPEALAEAMDRWRAKGGRGLMLAATDAVFSMDGDAADLAALQAICEARDAWLLVDEAHATGLLGPTGAGLVEAAGLRGRVPLVMGTLGKALGGYGAYLAADRAVLRHVVNTCRGLIFSTALPPPVAGAALEAVRTARAEPWRRARALGHAARLRAALGLPEAPSAIVPVVLGPDGAAVDRAARLQALGFDVRAVRPPTVPEGSARLRLTTGAHLAPEDVDALLAALEAMP